MARKLTIKQKLFIRYYLSNGFNATQAAISAGYSKKTARVIGQENLLKPAIKEAIEKQIKSYLTETDKEVMKILKSLDEIIDSDIGDFANIETIILQEEFEDSHSGKIVPAITQKVVIFNDTENLNTKLISEISSGPNGIKIKMKDSEKAKEMKGRFLKMWDDGINIISNPNSDDVSDHETRKNRLLELLAKREK